MDVWCFDIASGGITAARFDEQLKVSAKHEVPWDLHRDAQGQATLAVDDVESAILQLSKDLQGDTTPAAVCLGSFMHSFLVLSSCCAPLSPIYTSMDTTASNGVEVVRRRLGDHF